MASDGFKLCPICDTPSRATMSVCRNCGSSLARVPVVASVNVRPEARRLDYDYRYGETDLYEGTLQRTGQSIVTGTLVFVTVVLMIGIVVVFGPLLVNALPAALPATPTPRPTLLLATVTPAPPTLTPTITPPPSATPTATETPAPCTRVVQAGDTLISIILSCGYTDRAILDTVLELNGISNPALIQLGQTIVVPWPTPTPDPNVLPAATPEAGGDTGSSSTGAGDSVAAVIATDPFSLAAIVTPTLPPGVMWYQVQPNDTILLIAYNFGANVEILSQLNPEVTFSQCDMGMDTGGPTCIVNLVVGQTLRVPAPTPTPTIPPTLSGSETATPTATATFNAPSAVSPGNGAHFRRDELVTLRWLGTGTLAADEIYRVRVENQTTGTVFSADTQDLFFVIPGDWQGSDDQRYTYVWSVSVINVNTPDRPIFTTATSTFTWQGRGGS